MEFYDAIANLPTGAPSWALSLSQLFSSVFEICVGRLQGNLATHLLYILRPPVDASLSAEIPKHSDSHIRRVLALR
jgi:hypothetical protein